VGKNKPRQSTKYMQNTSTLETPRSSTAKFMGNNMYRNFLRISNVGKIFLPTFLDYVI
jgi:hypothetical protein